MTTELETVVKCRASTALLAGKMLTHLSRYGAPEISKPMKDVADELLQAVTDQLSLAEIEAATSSASNREGT